MAGFNVVNSMAASEYSGQTQYVDILVANPDRLAVGDMVVSSGTSGATGVMSILQSGVGGPVLGVVGSFAPRFAGEALDDAGGIPATTAGNAQIITDQNTLFRVEASNGPFVNADVGLNCPIVATDATKTGGITTSNMTANHTGIAATAALPLRVVGLALDDQGDNLGSFVFVRINNSTYGNLAAGV